MWETIETLTLVGGAGASATDVAAALALAPTCIAADGGAAAALAAGVMPMAIIGDMDSLEELVAANLGDLVIRVDEQATTDFEKCLLRTQATRIVAPGFLGGRLDHQLSVLNVLARFADRRIVLVGAVDVVTLLPAELAIALPAGSRLSLMPLGPARVWSEGLRWNLTGEAMAPAGFLSISNEVAGPVRLRGEGPVALVLPRDALGRLWDALA